jgi:hypothetical protein
MLCRYPGSSIFFRGMIIPRGSNIQAHGMGVLPLAGQERGKTGNVARYVTYFVAESERTHPASTPGATRPTWAPLRDPNRFYISRLRRLTWIHSPSRADLAVPVLLWSPASQALLSNFPKQRNSAYLGANRERPELPECV